VKRDGQTAAVVSIDVDAVELILLD